MDIEVLVGGTKRVKAIYNTGSNVTLIKDSVLSDIIVRFNGAGEKF